MIDRRIRRRPGAPGASRTGILAMKRLLIALTVAFAGLAVASAADARPRPARCVIRSADSPTWRGPCLFTAERNGSFAVTPPAGRRFPDGITMISLGIVSRGVGEVRGLTRDGINSRWGEALRSPSDPACWVGDDFSVCVY